MLIRKISGFSLIELMIGLLVGTIVVAGAIATFSNSSKNSTDNLNLSMLNQDLRIMMDIMIRDIRRAGYMAIPSITDETTFLNAIRHNPFAELRIENSGECITYMYDKPSGVLGSLDNAERLGFKLLNGELRMRRTATALPCATTTSTLWESITSPNVKITQLDFALTETALNISQKQLNPASAVQTNCNVGDKCLFSRTITITLSGTLQNDASMEQTLTDTVHVRNDQYCNISSLTPDRLCI